MKNLVMFLIVLVQSGCANDSYYYNNNKKTTLTPNASISRSSSTADYYSTETGIVVGVTQKIIVKVKDNSNMEKYLYEFNLSIEKELGQNLYLLKATDKKLTINIANRLSEKDDIEYAHPDFIKKRMSR